MIQEAVITPLAQPPASDRPLRLASALNLRRDLYLFVDFVQREGLKRAHRTNGVPKGPALRKTRTPRQNRVKSRSEARDPTIFPADLAAS